MNPRDLAVVAAVVVLAGFALADALRSGGSAADPAATTTRAATTERRDADTTSEADAPRRRIFPKVGAAGSLVLLEGDDCRLREVSVPTGVEFPLPPIDTSCELRAPRARERVAYGVGPPRGATVPFRFVDLNHPGRNLGAFEAFRAVIVWSPDGQRAAWCDGSRTGFEYELGRELRRLDRCPHGYTDDGRVATRDDRRIVVDGRAVVEASRPVEAFWWGSDGSVAALLEDGTLERYEEGRLTAATRLPPADSRPVLAPDNCAALLVREEIVELVDLGCFEGRGSFTNISPDNCLDRRNVMIARCARFGAPRTFVGRSATWSPDGTWVAVAERRTIAFHRVVGRYDVVRWDVEARALAWVG